MKPLIHKDGDLIHLKTEIFRFDSPNSKLEGLIPKLDLNLFAFQS